MDILGTVGKVLSGGALGVVGSIGSGIINMIQTKNTNAHELAVMAANLEAAKAAGLNQVTLDSIKMMSSSYEADKASYQNASGIDVYRGSVRPTVCYFLVGMSTWLGFWAFSRVGAADTVIAEIAVMSMNTCLEMASMALAWYFGARYMAKRK